MTTIPGRPETDPADAELLARLDKELATLPDKYRDTVVLCELEGQSLKEVAEALGVPQGTVASRLARGRELLAARLRKSVSAASVAAVMASMTSSAMAVPPRLLELVVGSAFDPNIVSQSVLSLTQGVIRSMFLNKLRTLTKLGGVLAALMGAATFAVTAAEKPEPATTRTSARAPVPMFTDTGGDAPQTGVKIDKIEVNLPTDVHDVLIVKAGKYDKIGVAQTTAISLLDTGDKPSKENIARLLEMFPNCLSRPAGKDPPIGFITEYEIFIFVKGDCVRLSVGANGELWSAGSSQFKTKGDFAAFLKSLRAEPTKVDQR